MISAKVYISGQIRGLSREHYMERFSEAERLLREAGYSHIVNPAHLWINRFPRFHRFLVRLLGEQRAYTIIMLYDLWLLMGCQRIYKIPGWKASRGAMIESAVAFNMNLYTVFKPDRERIDKQLEKMIIRQEKNAHD